MQQISRWDVSVKKSGGCGPSGRQCKNKFVEYKPHSPFGTCVVYGSKLISSETVQGLWRCNVFSAQCSQREFHQHFWEARDWRCVVIPTDSAPRATKIIVVYGSYQTMGMHYTTCSGQMIWTNWGRSLNMYWWVGYADVSTSRCFSLQQGI